MAAAAIGAGAGGLMGLVQQHQKMAEYNRQKQLAADVERQSPWTGQHGQMPSQVPNALNSVMQGATSGMMMGQGLGGAGAAGGAAGGANPMAGATQMGANPAMGQMAGGYSQSPWAQQAPNFYNS